MGVEVLSFGYTGPVVAVGAVLLVDEDALPPVSQFHLIPFDLI
jgi:hypothetical protein